MQTSRPAPINFTFVMIEQYAAMPFVSAIEGLRAANRILGEEAYSWRLISNDGAPVMASNNIETPVNGSLSDEIYSDYLFVVASLDYDPPYRARLHAYLRRAAHNGSALGALSLGTWILARAGLLNDAACTIHWEGLPAFCETFPEIRVTNELFVIDNNRYTASGGLAGMEIVLEIIRRDHGDDVVQKIANVFQLDQIRTSSSRQRPGGIGRLDTLPGIVQQTVTMMQENIEQPMPIAAIAAQLNTSVRNLERAFMRHLTMSPAKYYLSLRLEKARELLMHTNLQTLDIALQCGFSSGSYFARCFQREFKMRPSDHRKNAS